jgi:hypothetical protein
VYIPLQPDVIRTNRECMSTVESPWGCSGIEIAMHVKTQVASTFEGDANSRNWVTTAARLSFVEHPRDDKRAKGEKDGEVGMAMRS